MSVNQIMQGHDQQRLGLPARVSMLFIGQISWLAVCCLQLWVQLRFCTGFPIKHQHLINWCLLYDYNDLLRVMQVKRPEQSLLIQINQTSPCFHSPFFLPSFTLPSKVLFCPERVKHHEGEMLSISQICVFSDHSAKYCFDLLIRNFFSLYLPV